jgi:hypothetical protein
LAHRFTHRSPENVLLRFRGFADERRQMPIGGGGRERARHHHDRIPTEVWKHDDAIFGCGVEVLGERFGIRTARQTGAIQNDELEKASYRGFRDWWCFPAKRCVRDVSQLLDEQRSEGSVIRPGPNDVGKARRLGVQIDGETHAAIVG